MTESKKRPQTDTDNPGLGFDSLIGLFEQTQATMQKQAARSVDIALVVRNWLFGWYIVEFMNGGTERKELYCKQLIKQLAEKLTASLSKGFSKRSLEQYRKFYLCYKEIAQAVPAQSPDVEKNQQTQHSELSSKDPALPEQCFQLIDKVEIMQAVTEKLSNSFVYLPDKKALKKQLEEAQLEWELRKTYGR